MQPGRATGRGEYRGKCHPPDVGRMDVEQTAGVGYNWRIVIQSGADRILSVPNPSRPLGAKFYAS